MNNKKRTAYLLKLSVIIAAAISCNTIRPMDPQGMHLAAVLEEMNLKKQKARLEAFLKQMDNVIKKLSIFAARTTPMQYSIAKGTLTTKKRRTNSICYPTKKEKANIIRDMKSLCRHADQLQPYIILYFNSYSKNRTEPELIDFNRKLEKVQNSLAEIFRHKRFYYYEDAPLTNYPQSSL